MTRTHSPEKSVPIAITGVGVLTPLADGPEALALALDAGHRSIEPWSEVTGVGHSPMTDFEATRYVNVRGMRVYNRATRLALCAVKLALVDAGLEGADLPAEELGLVAASTWGHLDALLEYDRSLVAEGLSRTNPALMPLALLSAPGAVVALSFSARAFSFTVSDGSASSLDALGLGARLVAGGRARACLVVGASALCRELSLAAWHAGLLCAADAFRVFDRRSRGTVLGEAAVALVLERIEDAEARGAEPKGLVCGQASTFATAAARREVALGRACHHALRAAGLDATAIGVVSAGANGLSDTDRAEARALLGVLLRTGNSPPVIGIKANLGDAVDASGLLQSIAALSALHSGTAPSIVGLEDPEVPGLHYARRGSAVTGRYALVTSQSQSGACSALVLSGSHDG